MIEHEGIIDHIDGDVAHVRIESVSACASCHAKGVCSAADQEEKFLDVPLHGANYRQGDPVYVQVSKRLGFKAVALGYVYPFLLLMIVLVGLLAAGAGELQAGSFALLSIVPYYLMLYLFRNRISSTFTFSIKKTFTVQ
ncbi:MAG: SoxR reducing system RseC family protein [Bacteroidales bacterium]|nr:SoxR reducing system RseC family protein [Bacteroidales bacterium]